MRFFSGLSIECCLGTYRHGRLIRPSPFSIPQIAGQGAGRADQHHYRHPVCCGRHCPDRHNLFLRLIHLYRLLWRVYLLLLVKFRIRYEPLKFWIALRLINGEALLYCLVHLFYRLIALAQKLIGFCHISQNVGVVRS